ncbi:hypothetical protein KDK_12120 [Dictyobacter kobayashii]|uniref:UDP-glucose 4-epimerase n=1 Tax=Dictyobacter kobayashii TaxID=2014872 RepID=A0A402AEC8_9CHLR|nr:hypothetical protein KDK_12120 [Dictyobacter kobayashii]
MPHVFIMSSARYLVTGGAGFIGSHITATLLKQGENVRILDNFSTGRESNLQAFKGLPGNVEIVRADIRDLEAVTQAAQEVEVIFHQAALASVHVQLQIRCAHWKSM